MEQIEEKNSTELSLSSDPTINFDPPITVHQADSNGVYVGETTADASPLELNTWLIPAGCVTFAPVGTLGSNEAFKLNENSTQWLIVEDWRGVTYWTGHNVSEVMQLTGPLPDGAMLENPPPPPLTEAQQRSAAQAFKTSEIARATLQIAILTDATDPDIVDEIDPADVAALTVWKKYRVNLNKVLPDTAPLPIVFPDSPD